MFMRSFLSGKICFDFSNYSKDSKFFDETNKKVIGKMKDEFGGVIVVEFVGLKSKMYSMKKIDGKECNTARGVNIATEFHGFKNVFFNEKIIRHKMDKRYVLDDGIRSLAYFRKDSVTSCKEINVIIEKVCND